MNKKFLIPFFALFTLIFISNVFAISGSLSPSRIEYTGDVGQVYLKTLTIRNTNNVPVEASVSSTIQNIVLSETKFSINANTNYSLPFNITIAKQGYDEGKINVRLKGNINEFLDLSSTIALNGNSASGNSGNNSTNNSTNTLNPNATLGTGGLLISTNLDSITPNAVAGNDLIINARIKSLMSDNTNFAIAVNGYENYADLLIISPQTLNLNYNEEKNAVIHLYIKNNVNGNKFVNLRIYYNDSYEEYPISLSVTDNIQKNLTDIAYVVKNSYAPNQDFINIINELGYNYTIIGSSQVSSTNFSNYKMILLGDERISNVPVNDFKSLFANPDYYNGWSSSIASTSKPSAYISNKNISITQGLTGSFNAYVNSQTTLYYLTRTKYGAKSVATTGNSSVDLGHFLVAAKENPRRVFFGITKSNYWSDESRQLFIQSIDWIIRGEDKDRDGYFGDDDCNDNNSSLYRKVKAYADNDKDGFGTGNYTDVCIGNSLIAGYSYINGDCNDNSPNVNPGAVEIPYSYIDENCDGYDLADADNDGYCKTGYFVQNALVQCIRDVIGIGTDCNDNDSTFNIGSGDIYKNCRNDAPMINEISKITAAEGEIVSVRINATDPENDLLTYSINDSRFIKNNNMFDWATGYGDSGNYVFRVNVNDGNLTSSSYIYVQVDNKNRAPVCSNIPKLIWDENQNLTIDLNDYCSDLDGDRIEFSLDQTGNENIIAEVASDGRVRLSSEIYWNGNSWIRFKLSDETDYSVYRFLVEVNPVNQGPIIAENLDSVILHEDTNSSDLLDLNDFFMDVDSNMSFSISGNNNVRVEINNGLVSFYPAASFVGNESVVFTASDGEYNASMPSILEVLYVRKSPRFNELNCTTELIEDTAYSCELSASDAENDSFNFSVVRNNNLNCSVDGNILNYISFKDYNGSASCQLRVRDNDGHNDLLFNVGIENVNDAPYFASYSPANNARIYNNTIKEFRVNPADVDSSNLSVSWILDNESVGTGNSYNFRKTIGWYNLLAIISDGEFNASNAWNIYVGDYNNFMCSEVNGYLCSEKQVCNGKLLGVYDSGNCCSVQCISKPPVFLSIKRNNISNEITLDMNKPSSSSEYFTSDKISAELKIYNNADENIDFKVYGYLYDNTKEAITEKATDEFKLNKGDSKNSVLEIEVPRKLKESNEFYVFVKVEGEGKKTKYYNEKYVKVKITRKTDDIIASSIEINPKELLCGDSVQINAGAKNFGSSPQEAFIKIESSVIEGNRQSPVFTLENYQNLADKDFYNEQFNLEINDNAKAGEYKVIAYVYHNDKAESIETNITLGECKKEGVLSAPVENENIESIKLQSRIINIKPISQKGIFAIASTISMLAIFISVLLMVKVYSDRIRAKNSGKRMKRKR